MTTKQIAEFSEVSVRTVRRWVDKGLPAEKVKLLEAGERGRTVDWSEEEVYQILEAGGRGAIARWMKETQRYQQGRAIKGQDVLGTPDILALSQIVQNLVTVVAGLSAAIVPTPARAALLAPPEIGPRGALRRVVESWARAHGANYHEAWSTLYREYGYRYQRDIAKVAKNRGLSVLDYAEDEDILGELLALAYFLYGQKETVKS